MQIITNITRKVYSTTHLLIGEKIFEDNVSDRIYYATSGKIQNDIWISIKLGVYNQLKNNSK